MMPAIEGAAPPIIAARDIVKLHAAGTPLEVRAIDHVSFDLARGAFAAIVGQSGSGKTTLLTLLGALDAPTTGELRINGELVQRKSRRALAAFRGRSVGFVFQGFDLIPSLTALENVALPAQYAGVAASEARSRAAGLLDEVGLANRSEHLPGQLSGGEQQRVAIARSLVNNPLIVLADEPTGELDSRNADQIMKLLHRFNAERGVTVVIVTHNAEHAARCDFVITLADGRVVSNM
ncbi:MAG: ABC transporter ATP-binding protein [Candidatus Eremiobacteraeota bacterium]|nr:ABC transporter ATP-binding protein [Candidatus Eremiobacteraeota bacterium]